MLAALSAHAQPSPDAEANLLAGRLPVRSSGVRRAAVLTDGKSTVEGDPWKTRLSAPFRDRHASVVYDLGWSREIAAAWLQADANDSYTLELSDDGRAFAPVWRARPERGGGLRIRTASGLAARGRYVRLRAEGGDGDFAISEVQLFARAPSRLPTPAPALSGVPLDRRLRDRILLFGLSLLCPLLLLRRATAIRWVALAWSVPLLGSVQFASMLLEAWPIETREVALLRSTIAAVAAVAVAREMLAPHAMAAHRNSVLACLALCGVLGFLAFYNLGRPQFYDPNRGSATFAHHLDLRQYYPTAKYFRELGYRRIYDADVAAYLEDHPERTLKSLAEVPMRDLDTLHESTIGAQQAKIAVAKRLFSPERWQSYKRDARWFRDAMGMRTYLTTLLDYGGNATPVWMGIAHGLFSLLPPDDAAFQLAGLIDTVLLLVMFVAIQRAFGLRTMLVSMVVFGANDFIMYGTNWGGATLRHDWLAYLGLAACALKCRRWLLGGALLGMATMIRAFPALCLLGLCLPGVWRVAEHVIKARQLLPMRELLARERVTLRVLTGAALAMSVAFALSISVFPPEAWAHWLSKVSEVDADPHPSSIALRNLVAGWEDQARILRARWPLYATLWAFYTGLVVLAARARRPEHAALLGLLLVPIWMNPTTYYLHFIFLLPLLAVEHTPQDASQPPLSRCAANVWLSLLVMCSVQYFTVLAQDRPLHFYLATVILFGALARLLFAVIRDPPPVHAQA